MTIAIYGTLLTVIIFCLKLSPGFFILGIIMGLMKKGWKITIISFIILVVLFVIFYLVIKYNPDYRYILNNYNNYSSEIVDGKIYIDFKDGTQPQEKIIKLKEIGLEYPDNYFYPFAYIGGNRIINDNTEKELYALSNAISVGKTAFYESKPMVEVRFSKNIDQNELLNNLHKFDYPLPIDKYENYNILHINNRDKFIIDVPKGQERFYVKKLQSIRIVTRAEVINDGFQPL